MSMKFHEKSTDTIDPMTNQKDYEKILIQWYFRKTGKMLDLKNPRTFNEKIQWLKLYDNSELKTRLSDKYEVRSWVKEKIGEKYLIPLLGVWNNVEDIEWKNLPERFVLKATHGSGWNLLINKKSQINKKVVEKKLNNWLNMNWAFLAGLELQYKHIIPRIIAEEYLENENQELWDYKVFCFQGKAAYIMVLTNRYSNIQAAFYDPLWKKQEFVFSHPLCKFNIKKPERLQEMIMAAETLAQGFCHVRVDFYVLNNGAIKFGEMTFTTASGTCQWIPEKYDEVLGNLLILPEPREGCEQKVGLPKGSERN